MFERDFNQMINKYGSRKQFAQRLGIQKSHLSALINGQYISLIMAIKIDNLSNGNLPAEKILAHTGKLDYAHAIQQLKRSAQKEVVTDPYCPVYSVNRPVLAINQSAPFCPILAQLDRMQATQTIIDENCTLIVGQHQLSLLISQQVKRETFLVVNLSELLHAQPSFQLPNTIGLWSRFAIGRALELKIQTMKKQPSSEKTPTLPPDFCPNWDKIVARKVAYVAQVCQLGSKNKYHKLKYIVQQGIAALIEAVDRDQLSVDKAYQMAKRPRTQQKIL